MHITRKVCIAAAAVTGLLAGPAAAQSVEWKDDGTVAPESRRGLQQCRSSTTTREDLGSEFGPDKKPFEGVTITVTVNGAGPEGRHQRPALSVPPDLGRADRRQGQHRRAAVRRALHQDDARSPERHRPVRRLHGRRLLVRRHRAGRLCLSRSTSCRPRASIRSGPTTTCRPR